MNYYNIYQDVLFYISCVGLVCCGIMILLVGALPTIWDTFTTAIGKNRTTQLIMLCFAVGAIMYGGTKNDGPTGVSKFIFDKYLLDNGSYSTNDTIVIKWKQAISNALPDDTPVYIEYKEAGSTNEWQSLASSSQNLGNYEWQGTLAGATNYNYNIWCYYVPPAPVHTNGIWTYNTLKDKQNKYILPLRAEVRDGGEVIATPKSKWDYEFYTNYVAWVADDAAAGLADGATVSTWTSNDGRIATKGNSPTIALGAFNGHAGISCTSGYFNVSADNNPLAGQTQWTVCAVLKTSTYGRTNGSWYNMNGAFGTENANIVNDWSIVKNTSGNLGFGMGVYETQNDYKLMGDANCVDGLPHVVIVSLSHDGTLTLAVDGAVKTCAVALGANKSPRLVTRIYIGMNFGTSQIFGGEIAELRVYQGAPASAAQRNRIGSELAKKYGATWNAE